MVKKLFIWIFAGLKLSIKLVKKLDVGRMILIIVLLFKTIMEFRFKIFKFDLKLKLYRKSGISKNQINFHNFTRTIIFHGIKR